MLPSASDFINHKTNHHLGGNSSHSNSGSKPLNGSRLSRPASSIKGGLDQFQNLNISDTNDSTPEKKLKNSLTAINEAFEEKVIDLEAQIQYWKKNTSSLEKKNKDLDSTIEGLQSSLDKRNQEYSSLSEKHRELLSSQDQLLEKYNQLRKYASKLQEFKKNICNLSGSTTVTIDADIIEQSLAIEDEKLVPKVNGYKNKYAGSQDYFTNANRNKQDFYEGYSDLKQPTAPRRTSHNKNYSEHGASRGTADDIYDLEEDTEKLSVEEIYDKIMGALNPVEFDRFSKAIEDFNHKRISLPSALHIFQEVIHDKSLFIKMRDVLMNNMSFQTSHSHFQDGTIELESDHHPSNFNTLDSRHKYNIRHD